MPILAISILCSPRVGTWITLPGTTTWILPRDGGQAPGVLHHVMGRGIERKRLFIDKRDRQDFNTRLAALAFEKFCTFCTSVPYD